MKVKKFRVAGIIHLVDELFLIGLLDKRALAIEQHVEVHFPESRIAIGRIPRIIAFSKAVFLIVETPEKLVDLLGLGIQVGLISGEGAEIGLAHGIFDHTSQGNE